MTNRPNRPDIVSIISKYIQLEKRGIRYLGLCPFHDDHHPSLTVHPQKQNFICYACGAKGDVFSFIMQIEKCGFREAIQKIGQQPPPPPKGGTQRVWKEKASSFHILGQYIEKYNTPPLGGRGVDLWMKWEVGVIPPTAPLPSEWKMMKGRILFPIKDENNLLVGYAARTTENSYTPPLGGRGVGRGVGRYLNTPGLPRARLLYGLHLAKDEILRTGCMYLVEGFKDAVAMHAAGFTGTVALMGTQMAEGQKELIVRYAQTVVIVMDGDEPGTKAAVEIARQLGSAGVEQRIVELPEGADPDSLLCEQGCEVLANYILNYKEPPCMEEVLLIEALNRWPEHTLSYRNEVVSFSGLVTQLCEAEEMPVPIPQEVTTQLGDPPEEEISGLLLQLFNTYLEVHLIRLIKTLTRQLTLTTSPDRRNELLYTLTLRREQLKAVSLNLGRSPFPIPTPSAP